MKQCKECGGTGVVGVPFDSDYGTEWGEHMCGRCLGSGREPLWYLIADFFRKLKKRLLP